MSFTNSTDAYQAASKIMSHDYANKYANYWSKKNKTIKSGKSANFKDSGRQKTYNAEFKAIREYKKLYPNDARFKFLDSEFTVNFSRRLQSLRPTKSCVRTILVLV